MKSNHQLLYDAMISKSQDSFILALEVINRPTIKFRTENFLFNICNAWELILKAYLIREKGIESIYYPKRAQRTLSLSNCILEVFTDFNHPTKENLNSVIRLRNTATHLILPEYDDIYIGLYQACILFYVNFLQDKFEIDFNSKLPKGFITIATNIPSLKDIRLTEKVDSSVFERFMKEKKIAAKLNPSTSVTFEVTVKQVKKAADMTYKVDSTAEESAQVFNRWLDYSNTHHHRQKDIINLVNQEFGEMILNQYTFRCVRTVENIESNKELFYYYSVSRTKTYSEKVVNLIIKNIKSNPNYIQECVDEYKKSNPRS